MPTLTFLNLSEEKKEKIIEAAIKEYSRVSPEEVLVKNIVEDAGIARGSFYQYFDSKKDLFSYLIKRDIDKVEEFMIVNLNNNTKDIFEVYIDAFDFITTKIFTPNKIKFHSKVFNNLKIFDEKFIVLYTMFSSKCGEREKLQTDKLIDKVDKSNLNVSDDNAMECLIELLFLITSKYLGYGFKCNSFDKARKDYIRNIEILKYGVLKK